MGSPFRSFSGLLILGTAVCAGAAAQSSSPNTVCVASAKPPIIRDEGITERVGEIVLNCSGQPNWSQKMNLTIQLNVNVTNRVAASSTFGNTLTGIVFTIDNGMGPQAVTIPPVMLGPSQFVYNGVPLTLSPTGTAVLTIAGVRGNASYVSPGIPLFAYIQVNGTPVVTLTTAQLNVGTPQVSLYASMSSRLICAPSGARLPDTITFSNLIASGAIFTSTRVTEGFPDALQPRNGWANLNADSGTRIIVRYGGFPSGATLLVPDVIAGSDAATPTAGGDYGLPPSGGAYNPNRPSLLLARVEGADANGAGGMPVYGPGLPGSGTVQFDTVSALQIVNGNAYVVYEVMDADPSAIESAQFPTFLGLAPQNVTNTITTQETVSLAPVSTVITATASDPIPRFKQSAPPQDCHLVGDCGADYQPQLFVLYTPLNFNFTGPAGITDAIGNITIHNNGSGVMQWSLSAVYPAGEPTGWITFTPPQGVNNGGSRVDALSTNLQPGTYTATIVVDAGPIAGTFTIPVTFTVTPGPSPTPPAPTAQINAVVNAASFAQVPVVPGSLVSIMGARFTGKTVAVTFDGQAAKVLFSNDTQINVLTPDTVTGPTSNVVVTVDGNASPPMKVNVAQFAPAVFTGGLLNPDWTPNSANNPVKAGAYVIIYATGLSGKGAITARVGDHVIPAPYYAGPAPGYPGVQQINLQVPADVAGTANLYVCGATTDQPGSPVCSTPSTLSVK
jgi:uncharacterized protein (TIGR03437 family)